MNNKKISSDKNKVYESYDQIGDWFDKHRSKDLSFEKHILDKVVSYLPVNGKILDIGCGSGRPIAEYFLQKGFQVTGVDASHKMLDLARVYVPTAKLIFADMRNLKLDETFDALILWHSSFHLPIEDQRILFPLLKDHANPGAILVFTSGPDLGEAWGENGGVDLYHASLSQNEYKALLEENGFNIISLDVNDSKSGGATVWISRYT